MAEAGFDECEESVLGDNMERDFAQDQRRFATVAQDDTHFTKNLSGIPNAASLKAGDAEQSPAIQTTEDKSFTTERPAAEFDDDNEVNTNPPMSVSMKETMLHSPHNNSGPDTNTAPSQDPRGDNPPELGSHAELSSDPSSRQQAVAAEVSTMSPLDVPPDEAAGRGPQSSVQEAPGTDVSAGSSALPGEGEEDEILEAVGQKLVGGVDSNSTVSRDGNRLILSLTCEDESLMDISNDGSDTQDEVEMGQGDAFWTQQEVTERSSVGNDAETAPASDAVTRMPESPSSEEASGDFSENLSDIVGHFDDDEEATPEDNTPLARADKTGAQSPVYTFITDKLEDDTATSPGAATADDDLPETCDSAETDPPASSPAGGSLMDRAVAASEANASYQAPATLLETAGLRYAIPVTPTQDRATGRISEKLAHLVSKASEPQTAATGEGDTTSQADVADGNDANSATGGETVPLSDPDNSDGTKSTSQHKTICHSETVGSTAGHSNTDGLDSVKATSPGETVPPSDTTGHDAAKATSKAETAPHPDTTNTSATRPASPSSEQPPAKKRRRSGRTTTGSDRQVRVRSIPWTPSPPPSGSDSDSDSAEPDPKPSPRLEWCTPGQEPEQDYSWDLLMRADTFAAAPVVCFRHAPMSDSWRNVTPGLMVEVPSEAGGADYWIATLLQVEGYRGLVRLEGMYSDPSRDRWVDLVSREVRPIGWCAARGRPLTPPPWLPPRDDWRRLLVRRLTSSRTLPAGFRRKVVAGLSSQLSVGQLIEVVDKACISQVRAAQVARVVGRRLHVRYLDAPEDDGGFWCHENSSLVHPVGWAIAVGHTLSAPHEYRRRCVTGRFQPMDATQDYLPTPPAVTHAGFKVGMKIEALDPLNLSSVGVATVKRLLGNHNLLVRLETHPLPEDQPVGKDWFCYHATSPYIFPAGFCRTVGVALTPPHGYSADSFSWETYLANTAAVAAPASLFHRPPVSHGFQKGHRLEAVDLMDPQLVCVATVAAVVGRLLRIHFDGWEEQFDQWVDAESADLFPVGWCKLVGHRLEPPRPTQHVRRAPKRRPLARRLDKNGEPRRRPGRPRASESDLGRPLVREGGPRRRGRPPLGERGPGRPRLGERRSAGLTPRRSVAGLAGRYGTRRSTLLAREDSGGQDSAQVVDGAGDGPQGCDRDGAAAVGSDVMATKEVEERASDPAAGDARLPGSVGDGQDAVAGTWQLSQEKQPSPGNDCPMREAESLATAEAGTCVVNTAAEPVCEAEAPGFTGSCQESRSAATAGGCEAPAMSEGVDMSEDERQSDEEGLVIDETVAEPATSRTETVARPSAFEIETAAQPTASDIETVTRLAASDI